MTVYVDTHCHVDHYRDGRAVLKAAHDAGVVTVAMTELPSAFQKQELLLRGTPGLRLAVGIHPLRAHRASAIEMSLFRRLIDRTDYVGEVGIDLSREGIPTRDRQIEVFDAILAQPGIREKVLSVHSRRAEAECIDRLTSAGATAILHWYSGPLTEIDRAVDAGLYFSVNPSMLRSKNGQRILERIPRGRVLTETDGPYTKVGGRAAEPRDVPWLISQLATRWQLAAGEAQTVVFENMAAAFARARVAIPRLYSTGRED
jgi:TatD DNase family protein